MKKKKKFETPSFTKMVIETVSAAIMAEFVKPALKFGVEAVKSKTLYTVDISDSRSFVNVTLAKIFKNYPVTANLSMTESGYGKQDNIVGPQNWDIKNDYIDMTLYDGVPIFISVIGKTARQAVGDNGSTASSSVKLITFNHPYCRCAMNEFLHKLKAMTVDHEIKNNTPVYLINPLYNHADIINMRLRTFHDVFIPNEQKELLIDSIDAYIARRQWYIDNNIPNHFGILLCGSPGGGKAEPYSNKIPTPTKHGFTLMGDLKIGDKVFDRHGNPTTVTDIFEQGERDIYRIAFNDGRSVLVSDEHLFGVLYKSSHNNYKYSVKSVKELLEDYRRPRQVNDDENRDPFKYIYRVPKCDPVNYPHRPVPINPWVLGCFIGNGCCRQKYLTISSGNDIIPKIIAEIYGFTVKRNSEHNYNYTFYHKDGHLVRTDEFFKDIPHMIDCYSKDKVIPDEYMYNDYDTRLRLIQGLMDTDGCINFNDNRYTVSYSSTCKTLLKQMRQLVYSFGYSANVIVDKRGNEKYTNGFCGSLVMRVPNSFKPNLFMYHGKKSKAMRASTFRDIITDRYVGPIIKDIQFSHKEKCRCIMVDNSEHLYLTENYIVTHNTSIVQAIASHVNGPLYVASGDRIGDIYEIIASNVGRHAFGNNQYRVMVFEDVDSGLFNLTRNDDHHDDEKEKKRTGLATILNALDGIGSPTNIIYVFTTNHIERLDPALIRPGRCDLKLEIPCATHETLEQFIKFHYGGTDVEIDRCLPIKEHLTFAELQTHVMRGDTIGQLLDYCVKGVDDDE